VSSRSALSISVTRVSAEAGLLTDKVLATTALKGNPGEQKTFSRMMFAGGAAAAKAQHLV
jgi:hypothetical protein